MSENGFSLELERREGFAFEIRFDDERWRPLLTDEPPPLGSGSGPNPVRILGAAVGNCLAASLLFCLQKARIPVTDLVARVEGTVTRREGRLRVTQIRVSLEPTIEGVVSGRLDRCLDVFEDFCVVTQSVREGLDVQVEVSPRAREGAESGVIGEPVPS